MTVAERKELNFTTVTDDVEYKTRIDGNDLVHKQIAGAFAPHAASTPDMTVTIDAGVIALSGAIVSQAQQVSGVITAPTTNPRIDRIVIDSVTAALSIVAGVEAASPVAPDIPARKIPIAQFTLQSSPATTSITNSMIIDERPIWRRPAFRGALVYISGSNGNVPDGVTTRLNFNVEDYDTDGLHDIVTNNERLTVPSGVTRVKLEAYARNVASAPGEKVITFEKNGFVFQGNDFRASSGEDFSLRISTAVINVTAGDYFTVALTQTTGVLVSFNAWFSMEIIE
ncbi:MAG: hypothetical protein OEW37_10730 [Rhodospirillaceae bacterium]|nr:hypothetical protein [Rhodospirillaceae bacterium]